MIRCTLMTVLYIKWQQRKSLFPIGVIPQVTVDNNLGQDRLAGPKALDPNY